MHVLLTHRDLNRSEKIGGATYFIGRAFMVYATLHSSDMFYIYLFNGRARIIVYMFGIQFLCVFLFFFCYCAVVHITLPQCRRCVSIVICINIVWPIYSIFFPFFFCVFEIYEAIIYICYNSCNIYTIWLFYLQYRILSFHFE